MNKEMSNSTKLGRPRSEETRQAILDAALAILKESGYRVITIESIAVRAKVGKQTIYRWWTSKAAVVLEAAIAKASSEVPLSRYNSLRKSLIDFLENTFTSVNEWSMPIMKGLMAEAQLDPVFAKQFRDIFIAARRESLRQILESGVANGELPASTDLDFLMDVLFGVLWYRMLLQLKPLDQHLIEQLVELVECSGKSLNNQGVNRLYG